MANVKWNQPFDVLRQKWHEVPAGDIGRLKTSDIIDLPDNELLALWEQKRVSATTGDYFNVRGWYHLIYKDILRAKKVIDIGSGFGIDGITFAQNGAEITFVDIVDLNLEILKRLCYLLKLDNVNFFHLTNLKSFKSLPTDYKVIWAQGSLITAPFDIIRKEAKELLEHLPVGGRWIELAYPKERWERDGKMPFDQWGEKTDGGAPWIEWYDLDKIMSRFDPVKFDTLLHFNFYYDNFNWFDLVRRA
ncbi:hypothetical protein LCGC14_1649090 [marine sediment metagenome]|uniref:Methyltransferase domain-containing protein n=1 Tax=marine sediment metagenome TaxID=412755 RepID=A0A0F9HXD0_9ZZZZ